MKRKYRFTQTSVTGLKLLHNYTDSPAKLLRNMRSTNLLKFDGVPVYQISVEMTETTDNCGPLSRLKYTGRYEYNFYIAQKIQTDTQFYDWAHRKYTNIFHIPKPVGMPAILTHDSDQIHLALKQYGGAHTYGIAVGKNIDWHVLDPQTDIVVDKKLCQIYPEKTGKYPALLQELLQKTK